VCDPSPMAPVLGGAVTRLVVVRAGSTLPTTEAVTPAAAATRLPGAAPADGCWSELGAGSTDVEGAFCVESVPPLLGAFAADGAGAALAGAAGDGAGGVGAGALEDGSFGEAD
jgi:hypothetical protein